jgi:hypothetical protein
MTPKSLVIVASLLAIAPVHALYAQDERSEGDKPHATVRSQDGGREATGPVIGQAVERSAPAPAPTPRAAPAAPAAPRAETRAESAPAPAAAAAAEDQRRRDGGRDRGDNPAIGRAVPRDSRPAPAPPSRDGRSEPRYRGGGNVYRTPPVYNNYYYYPRRYYPYGYGAFGLGYFYYDPYTWYPPSYYSGYYGGGYYDPFYGDSFFHDIGELRLSVSPRYADVYVDGYFSGRVDEFDGVFQALKLEAGPHHVQIVAPGFAPLDFDVRIEPGRKITYRGALQPFRP